MLAASLITVVMAGCGGASATPSATTRPVQTPAQSSASKSPAAPSGSAAGSSVGASPSATDDSLSLPHADSKLEALLPKELGGAALQSYSVALSVYLASATGGDSVLYTPWLVSMGKTAQEVTMAVATDVTRTENVIVEAFAVPGVSDAKIASAFGDAATGKGWKVSSGSVAQKACLEIVDPSPTGDLSTGYAYAKAGVLYVVVTDDPALLLAAYIHLP
jgi:hypothetical protein